MRGAEWLAVIIVLLIVVGVALGMYYGAGFTALGSAGGALLVGTVLMAIAVAIIGKTATDAAINAALHSNSLNKIAGSLVDGVGSMGVSIAFVVLYAIAALIVLGIYSFQDYRIGVNVAMNQ